MTANRIAQLDAFGPERDHGTLPASTPIWWDALDSLPPSEPGDYPPLAAAARAIIAEQFSSAVYR